MFSLPNHMEIVRLYKEIPTKMVAADTAGEAHTNFVENRKLLFLFRIMETRGLSLIHEETLREINRSLVQLIRKQSFEEIDSSSTPPSTCSRPTSATRTPACSASR